MLAIGFIAGVLLAHSYGGSHRAQSRQGSCSQSYQQAIRGRGDCMQRRQYRAPWRYRSSYPFRAQSRRLSTRLGRRRSWQLSIVSQELPDWCRADSLELALRRVAAEHSDNPIYLVLPAARISSRAGIDSVRGVSEKVSYYSRNLCGRRTGINSVQIIQVRGEAQSFDGAVDILLDVRGGVGD